MIIAVIFLLGIGNFALHRAVLESGHPLLGQLPGGAQGRGWQNRVRFTFVLEFFVLVAAMAMAENGWPSVVWAYLIYTGINGISAWLILTRRI